MGCEPIPCLCRRVDGVSGSTNPTVREGTGVSSWGSIPRGDDVNEWRSEIWFSSFWIPFVPEKRVESVMSWRPRVEVGVARVTTTFALSPFSETVVCFSGVSVKIDGSRVGRNGLAAEGPEINFERDLGSFERLISCVWRWSRFVVGAPVK